MNKFGDRQQSGLRTKSAISADFLKLLLIALVPLIFFWLVNSPPAAAQSAGEYFQLGSSSANLSLSEVNADVLFYATVSGKLTCFKDLPMSVSEAVITSRIIAKNMLTGAVVTLNPSSAVTIKPFPSKAGEIGEMDQTIPLRFPLQADSGDYDVVAELIEAKAKVLIWVGVTEYLPQSQIIGQVKYVSPGISQAPSPLPAASPPPTVAPSPPAPPPALAPVASLPPVPASVPGTTQSPALPEPGFTWWMRLVVAGALVTTIVNIYLIMRYRKVRQAGR